jgi:hypothetical protein
MIVLYGQVFIASCERLELLPDAEMQGMNQDTPMTAETRRATKVSSFYVLHAISTDSFQCSLIGWLFFYISDCTIQACKRSREKAARREGKERETRTLKKGHCQRL